jgi:hypothetical protein
MRSFNRLGPRLTTSQKKGCARSRHPLKRLKRREESAVRKKSKSGDYKVGKGRPPLATRWKPGQSGNPAGRPKGAKNLNVLFHEALSQTLVIEEHGKSRRITAREGIVLRMVQMALKGDQKAVNTIFARDKGIASVAAPTERITSNTSAEEASKIYQRLVKGAQ